MTKLSHICICMLEKGVNVHVTCTHISMLYTYREMKLNRKTFDLISNKSGVEINLGHYNDYLYDISYRVMMYVRHLGFDLTRCRWGSLCHNKRSRVR